MTQGPVPRTAIQGFGTIQTDQESRPGCIYCLAQGLSMPLITYFMFQGTIYCDNHAAQYIFPSEKPERS